MMGTFSHRSSSSWLHLAPCGLMIFAMTSRGFRSTFFLDLMRALRRDPTHLDVGFRQLLPYPSHILLSASIWRMGVCLRWKERSPITSFSDRFRWFWQVTQNGSRFTLLPLLLCCCTCEALPSQKSSWTECILVPFAALFERRRQGGRVGEKHSLFNRKQQGLWGNGTGASELSTRYNYSCQLNDWCLPLLLAMNEIGKQIAWNARVWCKEKELLSLRKRSLSRVCRMTSFSLRKPVLLIWFDIL